MNTFTAEKESKIPFPTMSKRVCFTIVSVQHLLLNHMSGNVFRIRIFNRSGQFPLKPGNFLVFKPTRV